MSRTKLILAATALTVGLAGCSRARKDQGEPTKQEAPAPQATQPAVAIQPEQPAAAGAPTKAAAVPAHAKRAVRPKPAATNQRTVTADTNAVSAIVTTTWLGKLPRMRRRRARLYFILILISAA